MEATAATEAADGPVMSLINKRIRNLRKKYKRVIQIEEAVAQGKPINKEQEDVLNSKPGVCVLIDELEKLRSPLAVAVSEEVELAVQQQSTEDSAKARVGDDGEIRATEEVRNEEFDLGVVEDLLNLLYFGSLFDVKTQNDFTSTMFTRTLERGCCLTYDYVTDDDATDLLGERDLDMISMLGGLVISRPVDSSLSHKNALQRCIEHAKRWIAKSNQPIESDSSVTYAELREKLTKIMATDYITTTPEMRAPVDVAVAAGNYASFQVPGHAPAVPVQVEGSIDQYQPKDDDTENLQGHEVGGSQPSLEEELQKEEFVMENPAEVVSSQHEIQHAEAEEYQRDVASKEQQYIPRQSYPNQRGGRNGGGSGRRGYPNGRGGRSSGRGGGPYQNGRNQYYDQPANYYPRNYYNNRGRGGRGGRDGGGHSFNNHGSAGHASSVDVGSAS